MVWRWSFLNKKLHSTCFVTSSQNIFKDESRRNLLVPTTLLPVPVTRRKRLWGKLRFKLKFTESVSLFFFKKVFVNSTTCYKTLAPLFIRHSFGFLLPNTNGFLKYQLPGDGFFLFFTPVDWKLALMSVKQSYNTTQTLLIFCFPQLLIKDFHKPLTWTGISEFVRTFFSFFLRIKRFKSLFLPLSLFFFHRSTTRVVDLYQLIRDDLTKRHSDLNVPNQSSSLTWNANQHNLMFDSSAWSKSFSKKKKKHPINLYWTVQPSLFTSVSLVLLSSIVPFRLVILRLFYFKLFVNNVFICQSNIDYFLILISQI